MLAFIFAGIIFVGTCVICLLVLFAAGMSDSGGAAAEAGDDARNIFVGGTLLALLVGASHWLSHFHIGW